jgi:hypothetical protein
VIYLLTPYSVNGGFSIDSGSITVTETAADDGLLDFSEIVCFTVNATDEVGAFSFSGTGASVVINSPIVIEPSSLTVPFPLNLRDENLMALEDPDSLAYAQWLSINIGADLGSVSLNSRSGLLQSVPASAPIRVAVPEPSMMSLLALGGTAFLPFWRRSR